MTMKNDEIELKEIILKISNFFMNNKLFWLIIIIVALFAFVIKYSKEKPYYSSKMIITSNLTYEKAKGFYAPDLQSVLTVLNVLQEQVNKYNYNFLKNNVGIIEPKNIKEMKVSVLREKNLTGVLPKNIEILVDVYDTSQLANIQESILNYCNSDKYIKKKFNFHKGILKKTVRIIEQRIRFMDTLEYIIEKDVNINSHNLVLNISDWNGIVALESNRYKYNYLLSIKSPITVVQSFSKYPIENNQKLKMASVYFVLVLILGIFILLGIEFIKYIRDAKK